MYRHGCAVVLAGLLCGAAWSQPPMAKDAPPSTSDPTSPQPPREESQPPLNPPMIGDYPGPITQQLVLFSTVTPIGDFIDATVVNQFIIEMPQFNRGAFKIAENESPRPTDRIFVNHSTFTAIRIRARSAGSFLSLDGPVFPIPDPIPEPSPDPGPGTGPGTGPLALNNHQQTQNFGQFSSPNLFARAAFGPVQLHRTVLGFEKTFLDGNASVGLRVPLIQYNRNTTINLASPNFDAFLPDISLEPQGPTRLAGLGLGGDTSFLGDVSVVLKYAPINDRDVLSFGMVITIPNGENIFGVGPAAPHSTLLQPYVGYIREFGRFYVHGFHSVVLPTDSREPTLLFNDIGLAWRMYTNPRPGFLRAIIPTIEGHLSNGVTNRNPAPGIVSARDLFTVTGGVHFVLGDATTLTFGFGTPMNGPRFYDTEATVQLNYRFGASRSSPPPMVR